MRNPTGFCHGGWDLPGGRKSHKIWFSSSSLEENQAGQEKVMHTFLSGTSERERGVALWTQGWGAAMKLPDPPAAALFPSPAPPL